MRKTTWSPEKNVTPSLQKNHNMRRIATISATVCRSYNPLAMTMREMIVKDGDQRTTKAVSLADGEITDIGSPTWREAPELQRRSSDVAGI
jgi:hypothetical protein